MTKNMLIPVFKEYYPNELFPFHHSPDFIGFL